VIGAEVDEDVEFATIKEFCICCLLRIERDDLLSGSRQCRLQGLGERQRFRSQLAAVEDADDGFGAGPLCVGA